MTELNRVFLIGRLTRDPELRYTPTQTPVIELPIAVNHTYRTKEGRKEEETCFIDVTVFGRQAEIANQYLSKGREVFIEGRLKLDSWENQEGQKRSKHRIVCDRMQFLGGRGATERTTTDTEQPSESEPRASAPAMEMEEDDLPF